MLLSLLELWVCNDVVVRNDEEHHSNAQPRSEQTELLVSVHVG